jgi:GH35 family endo-1,4-beta-xylanase
MSSQNRSASHQPASETFTTAQKHINTAMQEYLMKYGFMKTLEVMSEEVTTNKANVQKNLLMDENTGMNYMLTSFNSGKREHFFHSWQRCVPPSIRQGEVLC